MPSPKLRPGDIIRIIDYSGLPVKVKRRLRKREEWPVRAIKPSGGVLLEGIVLGHQIVFPDGSGGGNEQGLLPRRVEKVKKNGKR